MTILALADRPPSKKITELVSEYNPDIICTLGDLETYQIAELANITNIPKIGVYGNHCSFGYMEKLGIKNMHLQVFEFGGYKFGGFEGSVKYKESKYFKMYTQEEAELMLKDFPKVDIFLTHCPPYGINDEPGELAHEGFKALRNYLDIHKPFLLMHGHTYPEKAVTKYCETNIVYVFGEKVVEI